VVDGWTHVWTTVGSSARMACRGCATSRPLVTPRSPYSAASSSASTSLHISKQQADATLKVHVARVYFKCFRGMLQVLYIDIAKVDRDVAYIVMAIHVCFKCMFQMFHLFQTYVASVLSGCCIYMHVTSICFKCSKCFHTHVCKCFIWMLHMFAMVFKCF
jgi:hypothetical protein